MKKIAISIGMAVATGVLLLGVNGAFGFLAVPTQDPVTANLVVPIFGGLDVKGDILDSGDGTVGINGGLAVSGTVVSTGASIFGNVAVNGNMVATGDVTGNKAVFLGTSDLRGTIFSSGAGLVLGDDTVIQKDIDASASGAPLIVRRAAGATAWIGIDENEIRAEGTALHLNYDSAGLDVIVGNGVDYSGDKTNLDVRGAILNGSTGTVALKISDGLEITGFVSNPTGTDPVTINDDLEVVGGMVISGGLSNLVPGMVAGTTLPIKIDDDLDVTGSIANPSSSNSGTVRIADAVAVVGTILASDSITTLQNLNAFANLSILGNADFRGAVSNEDAKPLNLADDVAVAGTLNVAGKLTADTLGTYMEVSSSPVTLTDTNTDAAAGTVGSATAACAAPAVIINCSGRISSSTSTTSHTANRYGDLSRVGTVSSTNTCYVDGHTTSGATLYLFAKALCFNPGV